MAATGKTPILLYGSTTATNTPVAGNLTNSSDGCEIAINVADKNLFFKDSTNTVNTVPIRQSSTSSNGWLSSTDWNTFNGKAPSFTYTTGYVPFGQGTTTPSQSANFFWDSTNNALGIGTTAPTSYLGKLTVFGNIATALGSKNYFWDASSSSGVYITNKSNSELAFGRYAGGGDVEYAYFNSGGSLYLDTGNLVIGTSGKGIDFSATAGTGTSELLADYEEGTWTPTVTASSGTITTVGTATGLYRKVGNIVTLVYYIQITTNGTGAGEIRATLPFTPLASYGVPAISYGDGQEIAVSGFRTFTTLNGNSGSYMAIQKTDNTYPASINGTVLTGSITYPTSS